MNKVLKDNLKGLLARKKDSYKNSFGHVLVIAGSLGMSGAAYFSGKGALRCGSGLLSIVMPISVSSIVASMLPEAMVFPLPEQANGTLGMDALESILIHAERCDVVVLGPGLSKDQETQRLVRMLVEHLSKPIILDADGLNAYEGCLNLWKQEKSSLIITPHYGEMSRLLQRSIAEIKNQKDLVARHFVESYSCVLVLKDYRTLVSEKDRILYENVSGNPGMATGGMGDVLTGMIASLVGQGLPLFEASCLGVYLHGLAGDKAAQKKGTLSLLPSDLLEIFQADFWKEVCP